MEPKRVCRFSQLLGQERAKTLLQQILAKERIPHGLLFHGPQGVGKMGFARAFAAAIHCQRSRIESCGNCPHCRKMQGMGHPDFMVVSPEKGSLRIAQIRELLPQLEYPPYESRLRVVVLEDIQTMGEQAANALLKTLEEPPDNNLFILISDTSKEVLHTIRSRCQQIAFGPLSLVDTTTILCNEGIAAEDASLLAAFGEGSPGRGLKYYEKQMLPLFREVTEFLADSRQDPEKDLQLLALADQLAILKDDLVDFLGLLRFWLRDLLVAVTVEAADVCLVSTQSSAAGLKNWSSRQLFATLQAIASAERQLGRNCNKNLVSEVLLFTMQRNLSAG